MPPKKKPTDGETTPKKPAAKPKKSVLPMEPPQVDAIKHGDAKRPNIPTRENTSLVEDDEKAPKRVLYPRDPSLDPQLVWKGKD